MPYTQTHMQTLISIAIFWVTTSAVSRGFCVAFFALKFNLIFFLIRFLEIYFHFFFVIFYYMPRAYKNTRDNKNRSFSFSRDTIKNNPPKIAFPLLKKSIKHLGRPLCHKYRSLMQVRASHPQRMQSRQKFTCIIFTYRRR